MCYDINPLGATFYLKDLERRAARHIAFSSVSSDRAAAKLASGLTKRLAMLGPEHWLLPTAARPAVSALLGAVLGLLDRARPHLPIT